MPAPVPASVPAALAAPVSSAATAWPFATAADLAAAVGLPTDAVPTGPIPMTPADDHDEPPAWLNTAVIATEIATEDTMVTTAVPAVPGVLMPAPPLDERPSLPKRLILARRRRPRVRKVSRVLRRVDAWSVFKISLLFWAVAYVILLVAGVLLWNLAYSTGTVSNVEGFIKNLFGLKTFTFDGQKIFHASWVLGAFLAAAGTGLFVTMAVLFNLISDLVGGVRVTVLEEEVVLRDLTAPAVRSRREQSIDAGPVAADNLSTP